MLLHAEFFSRFQDFNSIQSEMSAVSLPFSADIYNLPTNIQLELIELQANRNLEERFNNEPIESFYNSLDDNRFRNVKNLAKK